MRKAAKKEKNQDYHEKGKERKREKKDLTAENAGILSRGGRPGYFSTSLRSEDL